MSNKIVVQIPRNETDRFFDRQTYEDLQDVGEVVWNPYDRPFTKEELIKELRDAEAMITTWGSTPISAEVFASASKLKLIAHMAGSVKPVVTTMRVYDAGVTVLSSSYAIAISVSEAVLMFILALGHKVVAIDQAMRNGVSWKSPDLTMEAFELRERTVGLIGLGMVAREVIKLLQPFAPTLLATDPYVTRDQAMELGVELLPLPQLLMKSDIISLHAPMIPETYHMIGKEQLELIRDGALLINTARGELIDQDALIRELAKGRFFAGLDVFAEEPLPVDSQLRKLDNVLVRPHLAGVNPSSRRRIGKLMVEEIRRFYEGKPLRFEVKKEQLSNMT